MKTISFGNYTGVVTDEDFEKEVFEVKTQIGDLVQIRRTPGKDGQPDRLVVSNGMNGYGENIYIHIKDLEVEFKETILPDMSDNEDLSEEDIKTESTFEIAPDGSNINDHED